MRLILTLMIATALFAGNIHWQHDYGSAFEAAKREQKLLLLFLVQPHCGVCKKMEAEAFRDDAVADFVGRHFIALRLPIRSPQLPKAYRVEMSPVLTFIDPEEDEIAEQVIGGRRAAQLLALFQRVLSESSEEE